MQVGCDADQRWSEPGKLATNFSRGNVSAEKRVAAVRVGFDRPLSRKELEEAGRVEEVERGTRSSRAHTSHMHQWRR